MDFFGIGQALRGAFEIYFQSSRATGRTTSLLNSLKDGDRVIFSNHHHLRYFKPFVNERDLNVELIVVNISNMNEGLRGLGTVQGRTYFDHVFIEEYHKESIERSIRDLNNIEKDLSGFDERHLDTRRKAEHARNWGNFLNI